MTTAESNKIINKWMWRNAPQFEPESQQPDYSQDWNALMRLVSEITPIAKQMGQQSWFDVKGFFLDANISIVYDRCLSFILWYNEQTKIQ